MPLFGEYRLVAVSQTDDLAWLSDIIVSLYLDGIISRSEEINFLESIY